MMIRMVVVVVMMMMIIRHTTHKSKIRTVVKETTQ